MSGVDGDVVSSLEKSFGQKYLKQFVIFYKTEIWRKEVFKMFKKKKIFKLIMWVEMG